MANILPYLPALCADEKQSVGEMQEGLRRGTAGGDALGIQAAARGAAASARAAG